MSRKDPPQIDHPYIFSVSQAETFRLCPRKWAYLKIDGLEDPGNEASQLGGEVHDQLEGYLERGAPIRTDRAGKIAMSGLPHLPPPKYPGMRVEEWFHVKIGDYQGKRGVGAYYRGLKDVEIRNGWRTKGRPFVSDHKTTKNFMWRKTPEDLTGGEDGVGDIQAGTYAYDSMLDTGAEIVDLQWTYMRTVGAPASEPTITEITREQVDRIIRELEATTALMIQTHDENPTALTVVQDPTGCSAFGGCNFKDLCKLTPQQKLKAMMTQVKKESGVLGKLAARKAAKQGKTTEVKITEAKGTTTEESSLTEEHEALDAAVNPPENEIAPVVTEETIAAEKAAEKAEKEAKAASKRKAGKAVATTEVEASTGVLSRALDAFWNVLVDSLAEKIAEKLKK